MDADDTRPSLLLRIRDTANSTAWGEFAAIYDPVVRRYAARCGVPQADIDDLVQDTLLAVAQLIGQFDYDRAKGHFRSWLRSVAHRRILRWLSGERKAPIVPEDSQLVANVHDSDADLDKYWHQQWRRRVLAWTLENAQRHFEPRTFEAFRRNALLGQPAAEVAKALGMTAANVHVCKSRVLARVRLEAEHYDG